MSFFFTLAYFCVSLLFGPVPNFTNESSGLLIITHIILEIELFTALNSFLWVQLKLKLTGVPFLFKLVAVLS